MPTPLSPPSLPQLLVIPQTDHQPTVLEYMGQYDAGLKSANTAQILWANDEDETLKIEAVRDLQAELAFARIGDKDRWVVLLHLDQASVPAQNAVLKMLEEPPVHTHFVATASFLDQVLPTVQSRCVINTSFTSSHSPQSPPPEILAFLEKPHATSHGAVITLLETYSDRDTALELVETLLTHLHHHPPTSYPIHHLQALLTAYNQLRHNGNVRLVLENCFFAIKAQAPA